MQHNLWSQKSVATNIKSHEPKAIFTHFYGHCINIAASDSMKTSRIMKDVLETTYEITGFTNIIRSAMQRRSVISNYVVLHELWDWSFDNCTFTEMKAQIRGVQVHMQQFKFIFGLVLGRNLLQHTDSLSVCVCKESRFLAAITIRTMKSTRADDKFALFCKYVTTLAEHNIIVNAPLLPRRRCLPARYENGNAPVEFYETPESRYRHI